MYFDKSGPANYAWLFVFQIKIPYIMYTQVGSSQFVRTPSKQFSRSIL